MFVFLDIIIASFLLMLCGGQIRLPGRGEVRKTLKNLKNLRRFRASFSKLESGAGQVLILAQKVVENLIT